MTWPESNIRTWSEMSWAKFERNNLLLNGDVGWVPGIVWGQLVDGLDAMAEACNDLWRSGAAGETLSFRRL